MSLVPFFRWLWLLVLVLVDVVAAVVVVVVVSVTMHIIHPFVESIPFWPLVDVHQGYDTSDEDIDSIHVPIIPSQLGLLTILVGHGSVPLVSVSHWEHGVVTV